MTRRGDAATAKIIATLHAESWRAAYRGLYPDHFLDGRVHQERLEFWRGRLRELRRMNAQLFLASLHGEPAGFTCIEWGPHCTHGAYIDNLHVLPAWQGRGVGRALVDHAAAWAHSRGVPAMYLFVFEGNAKARKFYAENGWCPAGRDMHTMVTGDSAPVLRLVKPTQGR